MEELCSRKNAYIRHVRQLASDGDYRRERGEYLCDGKKTLREAICAGAELRSVLWKEHAEAVEGLNCSEQYCAPEELFDYASPMKNSPGPLFCVGIPRGDPGGSLCGSLSAQDGARHDGGDLSPARLDHGA